MTPLRATIVVFTFGVIALFGANRAHTQTASLPSRARESSASWSAIPGIPTDRWLCICG